MTATNRIIVVTGASSGIGAATAKALAIEGVLVACLSRRGTVPAGDDAAQGDRFVGVECDVSDEDSRVAAIAQISAMGHPIDGLVNAAGYQIQTPSAEVAIDEIRQILETNLIGAIRLSQLLFDALTANESGGLIVNVGSFYAKLGVPNFLAYSASKAALEAATRTLGVEWARRGVRVLNVAPGYIETGLNADFLETPGNRELLARKVPVGRLGTSEEVARLIAALFQERIGFLTGETIYIDGAHGVRL